MAAPTPANVSAGIELARIVGELSVRTLSTLTQHTLLGTKMLNLTERLNDLAIELLAPTASLAAVGAESAAPVSDDEAFQNFLSYSGMSDEPDELKAKLREAFDASR